MTDADLGAALPLPVPSAEMQDRLARRRSASAQSLTAPGPTRAEIERILRLGARTPDHAAFLDELQERSEEKGGPLVIKLDRAPGAREQRWAHLLCGPVDASAAVASRKRPRAWKKKCNG